MSVEEEFLELVATLAEARPLQVDPVSQAIGTELAVVPEKSNDYFVVVRSDEVSHPLIETVELRVPSGEADAPDGLLILELAKDCPIDEAQVKARFGEDFEPSVPTPRQPPETPLYHTYGFDWGKLSFGFAREPGGKLRAVVVDATAPDA